MKNGCLGFFGMIFITIVAVVAAVAAVRVLWLAPPSGDRVGVLEIKGFIADSAHAVEGLKHFAGDDSVKAVVIRVASPGGVVAPSQEIHDQVKKTAAVKPVVVSFGPLAASGGYYLSVPATKIYTNPGTVTGSIGVILQFQRYNALMDKLGLRFEAVKSGEFKDTGTPFRDMRPEERALMQSVVDDIFNQFVDAVAAGRKMKREKVLELADGRIYTGKKAVELGLADKLGGYEDALAEAANLGGLTGDPKVEKWEKQDGGLLSLILGSRADVASTVVDPMTAPPIRFVLPNW